MVSAGDAYIPPSNSVDITPKQDGGVLKSIISEGKGESYPAPGCQVYVHYDGRLTDGTVFDSSRDRGTPFDFQLGKGKVIKGWDIGIATMKVNEKALLIIREDYGYGSSGSPPKIPPNATLLFEVELIEFDAENLSGKKDKGILRYPITPGTSFDCPSQLSEVKIHLKGEHEGRVFDDREVSFMLGTGCSVNIPSGVEKALESFNLNETSKLVISPKYGFGLNGHKEFGIPSDATLTYHVTLKSFEKVKKKWLMETGEKLQEAKRLKEKGTEYFKKEDFKLALKMYKKMVEFVEEQAGFKDEEEKERQQLVIAAYSNMSLCLLKLGRHTDAITNCTLVLNQEPNNEKALFRRGQALLAISEPEKAKKDFEKVLKLDPTNKACGSQIASCNLKMKEIKQKEKKLYADMFEKFAQKDREWRFGWLEGEKPQVELAPENSDIAKERERRRKEKLKFLEDTKKLLEEKRAREAKEKETCIENKDTLDVKQNDSKSIQEN